MIGKGNSFTCFGIERGVLTYLRDTPLPVKRTFEWIVPMTIIDKQIGMVAAFDLILTLPLRIQRPHGGAMPFTGCASAGAFACAIPASL
jgi:hypothetical protein